MIARAPPVIRIKRTARMQVITDSVSSQPRRSCHAGSANRKKFSGLPKIGSAMLLAAGGMCQKSASVAHSPLIAAPVANATTTEKMSAMVRRTGSTGSRTGFPPIRIVWPSGRSGRWARFRAMNDPYRMTSVAAAKTRKTSHRRFRVLKKTSPWPRPRSAPQRLFSTVHKLRAF